MWAVVPEGGLAFLLGSLAFPLFNVSLSAGAAYLVFAVALFLVARTRPITALWPAFALLLTPAYLTLLAPAAAALLGRLRGPLTAAWAGVGTIVFLLLMHAQRGPFTFEQPRWPMAGEVAAAGDPFTAAGRVLAHVLAAPTLLQALVWAGLAAALAYALTRRRLELRLWIWSLVLRRGLLRVPHRARAGVALSGGPVAARLECGRARRRDTLAAGPDHRRSTGGRRRWESSRRRITSSKAP